MEVGACVPTAHWRHHTHPLEEQLQPVLADSDIRAHPAFGQLVRIARTVNRVSGSLLLLAVATAVIVVVELPRNWVLFLANFALFNLVNIGAQTYFLRRNRTPLAAISDDRVVQGRAWKLAYNDAKPWVMRLTRRLVRPPEQRH
jgi:hypothetical protein